MVAEKRTAGNLLTPRARARLCKYLNAKLFHTKCTLSARAPRPHQLRACAQTNAHSLPPNQQIVRKIVWVRLCNWKCFRHSRPPHNAGKNAHTERLHSKNCMNSIALTAECARRTAARTVEQFHKADCAVVRRACELPGKWTC